MTKTTIFALAALAALSAPVVAAPPASKDACLSKAFALAEAGVKKKLAADVAAKLDEQLKALEGKCAAGDLAGAEADIKAAEATLAAK